VSKVAVAKSAAADAKSAAADAGVKNADGKVEITVKGIKLHVWSDMLEDLELLEDLIALDDGENRASISALKRVLGDEYALVKDSLRDKRGIVKTKDVGAFFFAVLDEMKAKNS